MKYVHIYYMCLPEEPQKSQLTSPQQGQTNMLMKTAKAVLIKVFSGFVQVRLSVAPSLFSLPLAFYFLPSLTAFTCSAAGAISKLRKKLSESIEGKRKLNTNGCLVLLLCFETQYVAIFSLEQRYRQGGGGVALLSSL